MSWTRGTPRRAARPTHPPSEVSLWGAWGAQPPTPPRGDQRPLRPRGLHAIRRVGGGTRPGGARAQSCRGREGHLAGRLGPPTRPRMFLCGGRSPPRPRAATRDLWRPRGLHAIRRVGGGTRPGGARASRGSAAHPPPEVSFVGAAPMPPRGDPRPLRPRGLHAIRRVGGGTRPGALSTSMRPDLVWRWTGTGSPCRTCGGVAQVAPTLDRRMRLGVTQAERARGAIGAAGTTAPHGSAESVPVPIRRGRGGAAPTEKKIRGRVGGPSRAQRARPVRPGTVGGEGQRTRRDARTGGREGGAPTSLRFRPGWGRGGVAPTGKWAEPRAARSSGRATRRRRRGLARSSGRPCRRWRGRSAGGAPAGSPRRRGSGAPPR